MQIPKIHCPCACHKGNNIKHVMACCDNGFITIPEFQTLDTSKEPLSPLAEKMMEAIFVKTGGRPENPQIARLCADIAEEHYAPEIAYQKHISELIHVYADADGFVNCPFCKGIHRHGGNGNGRAHGHRVPDCGSRQEYFVVPEHKWKTWK